MARAATTPQSMETMENASLPAALEPGAAANSSMYAPIDSIEYHYHPAFVIIMSALMVLFIIFSVLGNVLVILTICRHRQMRTRTNLFLVNLAVADVMVALLDMPVALVTLIEGRWVFGEVLCQMNAFFVGLGTMLSIHTLMHISIHKYISMTRPFSRFMTRQKIIALIVAAWLWCIGYNLTPQMGLTHTVYKRGTTQCGPEMPHTVGQRIHSGINSLVNLYLPLVVMIFCYFRIFQEIRAHLGRMRENSNMAQRSSVLQQQRIAITLFLVLACFLLCIAPYTVYSNVLVVARDKSSVPLMLNPISYWFVYLSSALNPIIYGARSSTFRQSYRDILCGTKRSKMMAVGSIRSVGSTRLYSQRISHPANSPFGHLSGFFLPATRVFGWSMDDAIHTEATSLQRLNTEPTSLQRLNTEPTSLQRLNTEPTSLQRLNTEPTSPSCLQHLRTTLDPAPVQHLRNGGDRQSGATASFRLAL